MSSALERAEMLRTANEAAVRDPKLVLENLTQKQSTFTAQELDRFLLKHVDANEIMAVKESILRDKNTIALYDPHTLTQTDHYTTTHVRSEEEKLLRFAEAVNQSRPSTSSRGPTSGIAPVKETSLQGIIQDRTLNEEQARALRFVTTSEHGLSIIEGRAGVGKSHVMRAIKDVYQEHGFRVVGLAPTNVVSKDMATDGFGEAYTVHSMLFRHKNGRFPLNQKTVLVVDEAAMLGNSAYVELFHVAKSYKCKVVLIGDDRQLSSVDRGGIFSLLTEKFGSTDLTQVRRQSIAWQKEVSEALGQRQVEKAVTLLSQNQALNWSGTITESMTTLIQAWEKDYVQDPTKTRLILATRNVEVDALNTAVREIRLQRGEIEAKSYDCYTQRGREVFSVGDRVCLTQTDKVLGIGNGAYVHIKSLSENHCQVGIDDGTAVEFNPQVYHGLKLGYASTVYKSQGKNIGQVYVLHGSATNNRINYVGLSRQTETLQVFVNREETLSTQQLIYQMSRDQGQSLSVRYLTEAQVNRAKTLGDGYWDAAKEVWTDLKTNVTNRLSDLFHDNKEFYDFKREEHKGPQQVVEVDSSPIISEERHEPKVWTPLFPVPEHIPQPDIENDSYLSQMIQGKQITDIHAYKGRKDELLGYAVRLEDNASGAITTPTLTYCENEQEKPQWRWQDFGENLPLYGQEKIVKQSDKPVLVVSGEKAADAAQKVFPDYAVISWPGGAAEVEKANWGPLMSRNVSIWPEKTPAGLAAAKHIEDQLHKGNKRFSFRCSVRTI
ncbi:MAG: AAA family ATPase, partial [Alphaproteobacteria bacterium]